MLSTAALATITVSLIASAKLKSISDQDVRFHAVGPGGLNINGSSGELSVDERDGRIVATAPLTNLKTGIALRDKHLRGYLATDKHPNATLTIEKSKLKLPDDNASVQSTAVGQLTLHGVTKPLKFSYKAKRTGSDYHVQGLTEIDIRDYNVEVPCYLRVCVKPDVKIKVGFKLREM
jgi:polyisoprenoid-binding protein YceI